MRLTRQSEIAIVTLAVCAERRGEQITTVQIARGARTTKAHAARIVALMVRHRLLVSHRGRHGGLELAGAPDSIRLGEVLRVTQPELAELCGELKRDGRSGNAIFDTIVQAAFESFVALMDRFTVADLVALPKSRRLACLDCGLMNPARLPAWPAIAGSQRASRSGDPGRRPLSARASGRDGPHAAVPGK